MSQPVIYKTLSLTLNNLKDYINMNVLLPWEGKPLLVIISNVELKFLYRTPFNDKFLKVVLNFYCVFLYKNPYY